MALVCASATVNECLSFLIQPKVLGGWDDAQRVGVTHATPPSLDTDDSVSFAQDTELDRVHDAPLQTAVDVLLPGGAVEVWLVLGEPEGVHAAIEMRVLHACVSSCLWS